MRLDSVYYYVPYVVHERVYYVPYVVHESVYYVPSVVHERVYYVLYVEPSEAYIGVARATKARIPCLRMADQAAPASLQRGV